MVSFKRKTLFQSFKDLSIFKYIKDFLLIEQEKGPFSSCVTASKYEDHAKPLLLNNPSWCYATEQCVTQPRQSSYAVSCAMFIITFHFHFNRLSISHRYSQAHC